MHATRPRPRKIRSAIAALAALFAAAACTDSPAGPQAEDTESGIHALQEGRTGVPEGCSRVWSTSRMDSVLFCPDLRPPAPR